MPGFSLGQTIIQEKVLGSGTRRKTAKGRRRNPNKPGGRTGLRNHSKEVCECKDDYNRGDSTTNWQGVLVGQKALICGTGQKDFRTLADYLTMQQ